MDDAEYEGDCEQFVANTLESEKHSSEIDARAHGDYDIAEGFHERSVTDPVTVKQESEITLRSAITLAVLVFINLLNYMDRFTLAGIALVLPLVVLLNIRNSMLMPLDLILAY